MFTKKPLEIEAANSFAIKLIEMALQVNFQAQVWPNTTKITTEVERGRNILIHRLTVDMTAELQTPIGVRRVRVYVTGLSLQQISGESWKLCALSATFFTKEAGVESRFNVTWEYRDGSRFPITKVGYEWDRIDYRWTVGSGLTSGRVWRETEQSGAWDYLRFTASSDRVEQAEIDFIDGKITRETLAEIRAGTVDL